MPPAVCSTQSISSSRPSSNGGRSGLSLEHHTVQTNHLNQLSVPSQETGWEERLRNDPILCQVGRKTLLHPSILGQLSLVLPSAACRASTASSQPISPADAPASALQMETLMLSVQFTQIYFTSSPVPSPVSSLPSPLDVGHSPSLSPFISSPVSSIGDSGDAASATSLL